MSIVVEELDPITDDELAAAALAADPNLELDDDALPFDAYQAEYGDLLPAWYMPAPATSGGHRRRNAFVATIIIGSLLLINALGLCITYGHLEIPGFS
jgi:hypothetical protein